MNKHDDHTIHIWNSDRLPFLAENLILWGQMYALTLPNDRLPFLAENLILDEVIYFSFMVVEHAWWSHYSHWKLRSSSIFGIESYLGWSRKFLWYDSWWSHYSHWKLRCLPFLAENFIFDICFFFILILENDYFHFEASIFFQQESEHYKRFSEIRFVERDFY